MHEPKGERVQPALKAGLRLGRWEWVALPELGLACLKAGITLGLEASRIAVASIEPIELEGVPAMRFRIHPLPEDERTFVLAEALLAGRSKGRRPRIRTLLALGERSWSIELELISREAGRLPLTLGRGALGHDLTVDPSAEAQSGFPRIGSSPP